ncbi:RagB/SusD family nutrient uptake outer membrane protein [Belliella marina]|uniref:RagB/SusD family nutrient uptake outer membrane protein n=1 Tax=Belliella marina TaxID=1644146 RepID=A0ABW4VN48_9BACT
MKTNKITYIFISLVLLFSSCEEWLDVQPRQSIDSKTALSSEEAVTAALIGVYARLREVELYGRDFLAIPDLLADNAYNTGNGNRLMGQYNNNPGSHMDNWRYGYYGINQINLIFEALESLEATSEYKNQIRGQLHFIRALLYHDLLRVYAYDPTAIITSEDRGGVPILEEGVLDVADIVFPARASIADGYQYVYNDLTQAYILLDGVNTDRTPHFVSQGAAAALFSRVALYNGDWERAIAQAQIAFESGVATFSTTDPVAGWRVQVHPESFFEIVFATPDNVGSNESLRASYMTRVFLNDTNAASHGNVVFSDDLLEQYEEEDLRHGLIQSGYAINSNVKEINKFASKNGVANLDNVPVIRYAEVILIKAEAHYHLGQFAASRTELNKIKTRAGLAAETTLEGPDLLEEILRQRRIELAFEGHRFFDLKRLGRNLVKEFGTINFDDFRILNNIPNREIDVNPNLVQNRGY